MEGNHLENNEILSLKTLTVDEREFSYYITKYECLNPYVLFIHGSGANKEWFPNHLKRYPIKNFNWIVPSLFGYDREQKPQNLESYTMERFADDLFQLVLKENISHLIIVGHSMGGKIGLLLSEKILSMERTDLKLIAFYNLEGPLSIEDLDEDDVLIGKSSYEHYLAQFNEDLDFFREKNNLIMLKHLQKLGAFLIWAVYKNFTDLLTKRDLYSRLLKIRNKIKLFFVYGSENKGKLKTEQFFRDNYLDVIEIPNAGHIMMGDNPEDFWELLIRSFQEITS